MLYRRFCVRNGFRSVCQPKCRSSADGAKIESYRFHSPPGYAGDDCGNRYVLRLAGRNGRPAETRILTGRLHATEAAAASDFETATKLHEARISTKLHIPRPVALLAGELRLVLYDFDPWMNLCEFFTHHGRIKTLRRIAARVGLGLAKLHCSQVGFRGAEVDFVREELRTMVVRSENYLHTLACGPDLVNRFHVAWLSGSRAARRSIASEPCHRSTAHSVGIASTTVLTVASIFIASRRVAGPTRGLILEDLRRTSSASRLPATMKRRIASPSTHSWRSTTRRQRARWTRAISSLTSHSPWSSVSDEPKPPRRPTRGNCSRPWTLC